MSLKEEDEELLHKNDNKNVNEPIQSKQNIGIPWHILDARLSIEELKSKIQHIAETTVQRVNKTPIQKLWL